MAIQATRLDPESLEPVGVWRVNEAAEEWLLSPYRHFAAHGNGLYLVDSPLSPIPTDFSLAFENMLEPEDTLVLGINFSGEVTPEVYIEANDRQQTYNAVNSLHQLRESTGQTWWQDKVDNRVWVKLQGGFWQSPDVNSESIAPSNSDSLYEKTTLHVSSD